MVDVKELTYEDGLKEGYEDALKVFMDIKFEMQCEERYGGNPEEKLNQYIEVWKRNYLDLIEHTIEDDNEKREAIEEARRTWEMGGI